MTDLSLIKKLNWPLVFAVIALNVIGILAIWSSAGIREGGLRAFLFSFPVKQTIFMGMGLIVLVITACTNYMVLQRYAWWLYSLSVILLLYVLEFGTAFRGARRWIDLRIINVQPSELAKIAVVVGLARYLMYRKNLKKLVNLIPPLLLVAFPVGLILLEPDLGSACLFGPMFLIVLFSAGASTRHILIAIGLTILMVPVVYYFLLEPYQQARIVGFLNPEEVPLKEGYHLLRSKIAIGTGGIAGKGFGQSVETYSRLVPLRHNDFIFTVIGEEGGFLGASAVILLYVTIIGLSIKIAYDTREPFGRLVVIGLVTIMSFQAFINIGMTIGLAPVTGLTLPFLSYGGSSLLTSYLSVGVILSVGTWSVPSFSARDHDYRGDVIQETSMGGRAAISR